MKHLLLAIDHADAPNNNSRPRLHSQAEKFYAGFGRTVDQRHVDKRIWRVARDSSVDWRSELYAHFKRATSKLFAAEKNKRPVAQERVDGAPHWVRDEVRGASTYRGFISSHKDARLTLIAHGDFAEAVELFTRQLRSEGVQPYFTGLFSTSDNEASPQSRNFNFGRYVHYSRPLVRMSRNSHAQHYYAGDFPPGISSTGQQQLSIGHQGAPYPQTADEMTAVRSGLGALSSEAARTMMRHRIAPRVLALHDYDALELENLYEELLMRARERGVPVGGLGVPYRGLSVPRKPVSQP